MAAQQRALPGVMGTVWGDEHDSCSCLHTADGVGWDGMESNGMEEKNGIFSVVRHLLVPLT